MPEVAESTLTTLAHFKLAAAGFTEISHRTQVTVDRSEHVPAVVEVLCCLNCIFLPPELDVHIASQVVTLIIAHAHLLNLSILVLTFEEHVLKEILKLFLDLMVTHVGQVRSIS